MRMNTIAARLEQLYPQTNTGRRASVVLLRDQAAGDFTPIFLWISMGAVLFVLLIACVNVANMQVARAAGRQREMAVRAARQPRSRLDRSAPRKARHIRGRG